MKADRRYATLSIDRFWPALSSPSGLLSTDPPQRFELLAEADVASVGAGFLACLS